MKTSNKYNARGIWYSLIDDRVIDSVDATSRPVKRFGHNNHEVVYFPSQLEYYVFCKLKELFGISFLVIHPTVPLLPKCPVYPRGKNWNCDFAVVNKDGQKIAYIEAKGTITTDFPYTLALLSLNRSEVFNNLWVVFDRKLPKKSRVIKNLIKSDFGKRLLVLDDLFLIRETLTNERELTNYPLSQYLPKDTRGLLTSGKQR